MNFRVIVAMLHPESTTSWRDTEKMKKFVGGTKATLKIVYILLRYLKIPRVHDFSHFLRKNVEIFLCKQQGIPPSYAEIRFEPPSTPSPTFEIHESEHFTNNFSWILKITFDNLNLDLLFLFLIKWYFWVEFNDISIPGLCRTVLGASCHVSVRIFCP